MSNCRWYDSFKLRMDIMGAEVPSGLFETYQKSVATLGALVAAANLNPGISAAATLSVAKVGGGGVIVTLAALGAAAYAGIVAGCMMMAAIDNSICSASQKNVTTQSVAAFLKQHGIYDTVLIEAEVMRMPRIVALS